MKISCISSKKKEIRSPKFEVGLNAEINDVSIFSKEWEKSKTHAYF